MSLTQHLKMALFSRPGDATQEQKQRRADLRDLRQTSARLEADTYDLWRRVAGNHPLFPDLGKHLRCCANGSGSRPGGPGPSVGTIRRSPFGSPARTLLNWAQQHLVTVGQTSVLNTCDRVVNALFSGCSIIMFDGVSLALGIRAVRFQGRPMSTAQDERVVHGPKPAFSETLFDNIALIRRSLRDAALKVDRVHLGPEAMGRRVVSQAPGRRCCGHCCTAHGCAAITGTREPDPSYR